MSPVHFLRSEVYDCSVCTNIVICCYGNVMTSWHVVVIIQLLIVLVFTLVGSINKRKNYRMSIQVFFPHSLLSSLILFYLPPSLPPSLLLILLFSLLFHSSSTSFPSSQIIHDSRSKLESLKDLTLILEVKLSAALTVDVYPSRLAACIGGSKWNSCNLKCGVSVPVFVAALTDDKYVRVCLSVCHYSYAPVIQLTTRF